MVNSRLEELKELEQLAGEELMMARRKQPGSIEHKRAQEKYRKALRALVGYQGWCEIFNTPNPQSAQ